MFDKEENYLLELWRLSRVKRKLYDVTLHSWDSITFSFSKKMYIMYTHYGHLVFVFYITPLSEGPRDTMRNKFALFAQIFGEWKKSIGGEKTLSSISNFKYPMTQVPAHNPQKRVFAETARFSGWSLGTLFSAQFDLALSCHFLFDLN